MAKLLDLVEGWTDELGPFTLLADGVAVDLTGLDIVPVLTDAFRAAVPIPSDRVRVADDATTGQVYLTPADGELLNARSPYRLRWQVTDGDGRRVYFPNADADEIRVFKP
jgi:hypothetical protein